MFVRLLITTMEDDNCIWCHSLVRPRQEAIECDVCSKWQHRKCGNIGITRAAYRQMVKDRQVINWTCSDCQQPNLPEEPMQTEEEEDDSLHASFNVELPFDIPSDIEEENIADDSVYDDDEDVPAGPVTYTVIDNATQRGKPKLVDNIGFSYTLKVLSSILTMLPDQLKVKLFVADFESGLWRALTSVFDDPVIQGCVFHWTQAIWRKTQEIGLQTAYYQKDSVYKFVRKLMALPFLPAEHIPTTFEDIAIKAKSARTKELASYVKNTWLSSTVWLVPSWSIFMRPVRTNNDVEGWHRRINDKAVECNKPFYELLELLHTETTKVPLQVKLIGEGKLKRCQRKKVRAVQGQIFSLWEKYTTQTITTAELLKQTMRLNGPVPSEDTNQ